MVAIGLSFRGGGTLHFAPKGARVNSDHYLKMIKGACEPDCHALYGIPPEGWFRQDGASSHTSNTVQV